MKILMKLADLLLNQKIIIQLVWGEQKIEFSSSVMGIEGEVVFVTPYMHNETELNINVTEGSGVICNVYADNSVTKQRMSWKNVELTTVNIKDRVLYCVRTRGFNKVANIDDRRSNERTVIDVSGNVIDAQNNEEINVIVHDISGVGVSFYAPSSYSPKSQQIVVLFTDTIDKKIFNVKVECAVSRISIENGRATVGCRLLGENREYQLYRFIRHLKDKNWKRDEKDYKADNSTGESEE